MLNTGRLILGIFIAALGAQAAFATEELKDLVTRLTAPPVITAAPGFSAALLVPPGQLYDPLLMRSHGDTTWLNDDGGEDKDKGSRLLALSDSGELSVLAGIGKLLPTVGFDIAPAGFGAFGGQVFTLSQPEVAVAGADKNHVVLKVDPAQDFDATIFCTLPEAGGKKTSGYGLDGRFGPDGSPFENKFFVLTIYNDAIYQVTADGSCTPFVVFDGQKYSAPTVIAFAPDGMSMLVSVTRGAFDITSLEAPSGAIVRVSPDGKIADTPLYAGPGKPMGMDYAPSGFGAFGGQLFFTDIGLFQIPVPMTQAMNADGNVYRIDAQGKAHIVASGLLNPIGLKFVRGKLWVTDINGDFIAGRRELPDGFIVELKAE